jgi:hypothetical protein
MSGPADAACPAGSQFFGYGGDYGCVMPGETPTVVAKCWKGFQNPCSGAHCEGGWVDNERYCCLAVAPPKPPPSTQETFEAYYWDGTAPFCDGRCRPGEHGKRISTKGCLTGRKIECCQDTFPR